MNMNNENNLYEEAVRYLDKGLSVIPTKLKQDEKGKWQKVPAIATWKPYQKRYATLDELRAWFARSDVTGIGIVTGQLSGVLVIDVEKEGLVDLEAQNLPETVTSISGGGGKHLFYAYPQGMEIRNCTKLEEMKIDVRGEGGFVNAPPSLHPTGNYYAWIISPDESDFIECPEVFLKRIQNNTKNKAAQLDGSTGKGIAEGRRNDALASLAGAMRHRGVGQAGIQKALAVLNKEECHPPLSDEEVENIAKSYGKYDAGSPNGRTPVLVNLEDVETEEVQWLWQDRIPYSKLTIIEGDPGTGKSSISMCVASAVTLGRALYGDDAAKKREPANVLLLAAEDGLADTIKPRLEAMGADVNKVRSLVAVKDEKGNEQHFSLEKDLAIADEILEKGGYGLVIIDPINAYMGSVDTHKDASVRGILTPLKMLAEKHGVAIVCIRHLTKATGGRAVYRGQGSIGFTGAARVVHLVGTNPEDFSQKVISCSKTNLSEYPPSLAFQIQGKEVLWNGKVEISADALLAPALDNEDKSALDEAKDFLLDVLSDGATPQREVMKEARKNGIAEKTLRRAKDALKVKAKKGSKEWTWKMPNELEGASCPPSLFPLEDEEESKMVKVVNPEDSTSEEADPVLSPVPPVEWE